MGDAEDHARRPTTRRSSCSGRPSKDYEQLVGEKLGWSRVPAGKRASTYEIPEYKKAAAAFGEMTLKSIEEADPTNPGVQPRPTVGIQFVDIPEFQDLGTKVTQDIAAAIAGRGASTRRWTSGQKLAEDVAGKQQVDRSRRSE